MNNPPGMNGGSIRDGACGRPWYGGHVGPLGCAEVAFGPRALGVALPPRRMTRNARVDSGQHDAAPERTEAEMFTRS